MTDWLRKSEGLPFRGIGFAIGLERLILALQLQNLFPAKQESPLVYLACIGREASAMGMAVQRALRRENIVSEMDLQGRSLKGQMKQANNCRQLIPSL